MSTKKMVQSPLKMSVMIIGGLLIIISMLKLSPGVHASIAKRKEKKLIEKTEALEHELKIIEARKLAEANKPIPDVIEFLLQPGESKTIVTGGDKFEYRFYGNTYFDIYRGKYAYERITFRNGSYENGVEYKDMAEINSVRISRPPVCKTPLGYKIIVHRKP